MFNFSDIFRAIQFCAMNTKSSIILKLPKCMVSDHWSLNLKWVKQTLADWVYWKESSEVQILQGLGESRNFENFLKFAAFEITEF